MKLDYKGSGRAAACLMVLVSALAAGQRRPGSQARGAAPPPPPSPAAASPPPAGVAQGPAGSLGPFLGAMLEDIHPLDLQAMGLEAGVRVMSVLPGGPAAGQLRENDVLTRIAGGPTPDARSAVEQFMALPMGRAVAVTLRRGTQDVTVNLTPAPTSVVLSKEATGARALVLQAHVQLVYGDRAAGPAAGTASRAAPTPPPSPTGAGFLGVAVDDNPNGAEHDETGLPRGALVRNVQPSSPAQMAGIVAGDVIVWAAGRAVGSAVELTTIVSGQQAGTVVQLVVHRNGQPLTLNAQLGSRR